MTCLLEETEKILVFNKRYCKFLTSVGLLRNKIYFVNCVFDTGTGLNITQEDFLWAEWFKAVQGNNGPVSMKGTSQKVTVVQTGTLQAEMRYSRVRVVFGVVRKLAVPFFLRTSYRDRFVSCILPPE